MIEKKGENAVAIHSLVRGLKLLIGNNLPDRLLLLNN